MDDYLKKEIWKVFCVASFLFISIFFVLPYLIQINTYFHEKSHQEALLKYGIKSEYDFNFISVIPNFFDSSKNILGSVIFNINDYEKLDKYQRADINLAGVVSDLRFLFLIGIFLAITNIYVFYKTRIKEDYNITYVLAVNWILFMWLLALVQITVANITYSSGDFMMLIRYLRI